MCLCFMILNIMEITIQQAIKAHQESRIEEAERLYRSILENHPSNFTAHYNLGNLLKALGKLDEAAASFRKAIKLKPDCVEAYNNLGNTLKGFDRFDEAEASFRKALELKPDYYLAHNNLGNTLKNLCRLDEAEASFRKAIEFKPDYVEANKNLDFLIEHKKLLSEIEQAKKFKVKTKINFFKKVSSKLLGSDLRLTSNPFILNRKVETELISQLYKINTKKLDDVDSGLLRYGNGKSSDYKLFENNFSIIKTLEKDLINILKETVKSDIFIMESFFNIFKAESGIVFHNHLINFDKIYGLIEQKYSLTYYLEVGDQNCSQPGTLKLQDPDKEILPSKGMIIIFPASRKHSAVYNGKTDRIMIGVNFYSLI